MTCCLTLTKLTNVVLFLTTSTTTKDSINLCTTKHQMSMLQVINIYRKENCTVCRGPAHLFDNFLFIDHNCFDFQNDTWDMKFVTDLHLHSKYSRAVSQDMTLPKMAEWARMKGIDVLATGDFCHPFWFEQLKNELEETSKGLFRLKTNDTSASLSASQRLMQKKQALDINQSALDEEVYFLLSCEISSIYSQGGKGRRIHNLFFFPSLKSVEKFNKELILRGANLRSDGRPIVGITSADLTKIALNIDKKALIIPAHAWIPWFSIFGSFSGFDSISECFGDMAPYIYGIETGLSSDPAMNWQIADLDTRAILSFSDAHSLLKMGREATVFEGNEVSYDTIYEAIRQLGNWAIGQRENKKPNSLKTQQPNSPRIAFTIEFHPEE